MAELNRWEIVLLGVVCYYAVTVLMRLMLARRERLVQQVQQQLATLRSDKKAGRTNNNES